MSQLPIRSLLLSSCLAAALLGGACGRDPQRQVADARQRYEARLNAFVIRDLPAEGAQPARQVIDLDILVRRDGRESLPGLTLDISVAGPDGKEKAHRLAWVDTSRIEKGNEVGVNVQLEGVEYRAGDGFYVEVRRPVPAAERAAYREFGGAS